MQNPRKIPIYRSLHQQNLILGCEREPILVAALLCFSLAFIGISAWTVGLGLLVWLGCLFFLRKMAKTDPQMRAVYLRHVRYLACYRARSSAWRRF
jgi:type IV secretion system protein VirB3